mmetsp:Transcript_33927/g.54408  ORF Transcript_33927/g.54408 Transcript_33927/m.54408 type:complete len:247 (+) Transcript_33927:1018-1758(+)
MLGSGGFHNLDLVRLDLDLVAGDGVRCNLFSQPDNIICLDDVGVGVRCRLISHDLAVLRDGVHLNLVCLDVVGDGVLALLARDDRSGHRSLNSLIAAASRCASSRGIHDELDHLLSLSDLVTARPSRLSSNKIRLHEFILSFFCLLFLSLLVLCQCLQLVRVEIPLGVLLFNTFWASRSLRIFNLPHLGFGCFKEGAASHHLAWNRIRRRWFTRRMSKLSLEESNPFLNCSQIWLAVPIRGVDAMV